MTDREWRGRIRAIRDIESRAQRPVFTRDPYVKFLPLILRPPSLDWSACGTCARSSDRRIVVLAHGREPIAREGWLRFALIATYSLLRCRAIHDWAIDLVFSSAGLQQHPGAYCQALFGRSCEPELKELAVRGVRVRRTSSTIDSSTVYRLYRKERGIIVRIDADSGALPDTLNAPFAFSEQTGHSGLNYRHTGRPAFAQLFAKTNGRMASWPQSHHVCADVFLQRVCTLVRDALGRRLTRPRLKASMLDTAWPSEGFSYIRGAALQPFLALRDALVDANVIPAWDEEVVKLLLVAAMDWRAETTSVQVLEYPEYDTNTPDDAIINFRNIRTVGPQVPALVRSRSAEASALDYLRAFVEDVDRRATETRWR